MYNEAAVKSRIQNYSDDEIRELITNANNAINRCTYEIFNQQQFIEICKSVLTAREVKKIVEKLNDHRNLGYRCKQCRFYISNWETCACHPDYIGVNADNLTCNEFQLKK